MNLTSLILPVFNPGQARLEETLRRLRAFTLARPEPWELLFVCDGCTDGSDLWLKEEAARAGGRLRVLALPENRGKGFAVRTGLLAAEGHWRLFTDVDLAFALNDVLRVAERLWAGAPVVIAVRNPQTNVIEASLRQQTYALWRRLQSRGFAWLARRLLDLPHQDTQAGLKGFSARLIEEIGPRLECDGFAFDCELLLACARQGYAVEELDVELAWTRQPSAVRTRHVFQMAGELLSIRRRWRQPAEPKPLRRPGRKLLVVADDFGIGPQVSAGILELAREGLVTATLLQTNSPHAAEAVRDWRQAGEPCALGWHPCLTLDRPLAPADRVPSLTDEAGGFVTLKTFLRRWLFGRLAPNEVKEELQAQLSRFVELVGRTPAFVAGHHHCQLFEPVGAVLLELLAEQSPRPWLRRVAESPRVRKQVAGQRAKRLFLTKLGLAFALEQDSAGFPGAATVLGLAAPRDASRADCFTRWLAACEEDVVELMCHPGYADPTLAGRDDEGETANGSARLEELLRLREPAFGQALADAGFTILRPEELESAPAELRRAA